MHKVISKSQSAFVEGRQILDAVLIANKAIDSTKRSGDSGMICKPDIKKAYDHVNWNVLGLVLKNMGFEGKFRK